MTHRATVVAPLRVPINKKGTLFSLNLNQYRNGHYHVLNKAKRIFKEHMRPQIEAIETPWKEVSIAYIVYMPTKRKVDLSNVCTVVDKFFLDALVSFGYLPDDNYEHVKQVTYIWGGVDKANPRVEITIQGLQ